jgi:hypothetical protein
VEEKNRSQSRADKVKNMNGVGVFCVLHALHFVIYAASLVQARICVPAQQKN